MRMNSKRRERCAPGRVPQGLSATVLVCWSLGACDGSDGTKTKGDNAPATPTSDAQVLSEGVFAENAVEGLRYVSESSEGVTDTDGRFSFAADENITFSVGDLVLGTTQAKANITPVDLFPEASSTDQRVSN